VDPENQRSAIGAKSPLAEIATENNRLNVLQVRRASLPRGQQSEALHFGQLIELKSHRLALAICEGWLRFASNRRNAQKIMLGPHARLSIGRRRAKRRDKGHAMIPCFAADWLATTAIVVMAQND
jgi:hypothetical protein